jgi:hypothetical protein
MGAFAGKVSTGWAWTEAAAARRRTSIEERFMGGLYLWFEVGMVGG